MEFDDSPPVRQSYLQWYVSSLGMPTLLLIVAITILAMALIVVLFLRGRGPAVPAAIMFAVPLPLIVALICFFTGCINGLIGIAMVEKPAAVANWISYALIAPLQASSCFCPLLMLALALLTVLGFANNKNKN